MLLYCFRAELSHKCQTRNSSFLMGLKSSFEHQLGIVLVLYWTLVCLFISDTVYFHLPPLDGEMKCVYGVSCYRQIEAKVSGKVLHRKLSQGDFNWRVYWPVFSCLVLMKRD